MTTDHDLAAAWLTEALGDDPDPPADLHAARLELRHRTRRITVQRRLAVVAITAAVAVLGLVVVRALPDPPITPQPAKHLQSGLPIGTLKGEIHYRNPDGDPEVMGGRKILRFVVRADATGSYSIQGPGDPQFGVDLWPVRYIGGAPGHVMLTRPDSLCTEDDNELALDFTVRGNTVTITHAVTGPCSTFPDMPNVDLRGVVLHLSRVASPTP
jgi:hypothetical protein